jgi:hypothetical protein
MRDIFSRSRAQVYRGVIVLLVESALPFTYVCEAPEALAFAGVWGAFVVSRLFPTLFYSLTQYFTVRRYPHRPSFCTSQWALCGQKALPLTMIHSSSPVN